MDHKTPIGVGIFQKGKRFSAIAGLVTIAIVAVACRSPQPSPPPPRDFTTSDLLIYPKLLPGDWEVKSFSPGTSPNDLGFRNNLGGSIVELGTSTKSAEHIVARFENAQDAGRAYADHDLTRNTEGRYASTHETPANFTYRSPIADQFRVTCMTIKNTPKIGDNCAIEAQYKEFLSILLFDTSNTERGIPELEIIARAIDLQMSKYLGDG
jgi:hypothetical protein